MGDNLSFIQTIRARFSRSRGQQQTEDQEQGKVTATATMESKTEKLDAHDGFLEQYGMNLRAKGDESGFVEKLRMLADPDCWRCWVIDPSSDQYYRWLVVVSLAALYNLTVIIARAVFVQLQTDLVPLWLTLDYLSDALYLIDMFIQTRKVYIEDGLLVLDTAKLRKNYTNQARFYFDVIAILPTDLLYLKTGIDRSIVRINRIARASRIPEFFDKTDSRTNFPYAFRVTQLVLYIILSFHWNACFYYQTSVWIGLCSDQWVYVNKSCEVDSGLITDSETLISSYTYSFYWSILTLTTMGDVNHPVTTVEFGYVVIQYLIGILIFATIIGNVSDIISSMNSERISFEEKIDGVKHYMTLRNVNKDIEMKVTKWFDYLWSDRQTMDEHEVLAALPQKLKAEIAMQVHLNTLKRVAIFQECEAGLLMELVLKLRLSVFSPGDYICRKGDIGKELYIIKRGKLNVVSDDGKMVFATLGEGVVFGEISILNIAGNKNGNKRTANIRSVGYADLFVLSKEDLWETLAEYPEAKQRLIEKGRQMLRKDNLLDEEQAKHQDLLEMTTHQKLDRLDKLLATLLDELVQMTADFDKVQMQLKKRLTKAEKQMANRLIQLPSMIGV